MDNNDPNNVNVGKHLMIGLPGPEMDPETVEILKEVKPGGVILFARNIISGEQTRRLIEAIEEQIGYRPLIAIDQEGGLVDRLRRVLSPLPAASKIRSPDEAKRLGELAGEPLSMLGFNIDLAPVVDVIDESRSGLSNGLYSRGFGSSREDAAKLAGAFIEGLAEFGILACLKHFPGLAGAVVDSHDELPEVSIDRSELYDKDLFPYRQLLNAENCAVMVGHAAYPNIGLQGRDANGRILPSSLDLGIVNGLLRGELGFDGVVITDDLEMGAIVNTYGIGEACVMALNAHSDMLAICASPRSIIEGLNAVRRAVREGVIDLEILNASGARIDRFKGNAAAPREFDDARLIDIANQIREFSTSLG